MSLPTVVKHLTRAKQEAEQQLEGITKALAILGVGSRGPRRLSAEARRRISATQKARWAKYHKQHGIKLVRKAA